MAATRSASAMLLAVPPISASGPSARRAVADVEVVAAEVDARAAGRRRHVDAVVHEEA